MDEENIFSKGQQAWRPKYGLDVYALDDTNEIESSILISSTLPWIVDRKEKKYLYVFSSIALRLSVEDLGTYAVPAGLWTEVSFPQGYRIYATNQTAIYIFLRATDVQMSSSTVAVTPASGAVFPISGTVNAVTELAENGVMPFNNPITDFTAKVNWASVGIVSALQGSKTITVSATPTGLGAGNVIELTASGSQFEYLRVDSSYISGSTTVPVTTPIQNAFAYNTFIYEPDNPQHAIGGAQGNPIRPWGVATVAPIGYDGSVDAYRGFQVDSTGNLLVSQTLSNWFFITSNTLTNVTSWGGDAGFIFHLTYVVINIAVTNVTAGSITFTVGMDGPTGNIPVFTTAAITSPTVLSLQFGPGMQNPFQFPGTHANLNATITTGPVSFQYVMQAR